MTCKTCGAPEPVFAEKGFGVFPLVPTIATLWELDGCLFVILSHESMSSSRAVCIGYIPTPRSCMESSLRERLGLRQPGAP